MRKISLLDLLNEQAAKRTLTKKEFGQIMHDPNKTDEEKAEALRIMQEADGYENLGD